VVRLERTTGWSLAEPVREEDEIQRGSARPREAQTWSTMTRGSVAGAINDQDGIQIGDDLGFEKGVGSETIVHR
jgi:hypothetical protein